MRPSTAVRPGAASSVFSFSTSRVRSSPVIASVSCGPMLTICTSGAISIPRKMKNVKNVPVVIAPARICRAPINIIAALTSPIITVEDRLISDVIVSVLITLSSSR